jgi:hypothetical protein
MKKLTFPARPNSIVAICIISESEIIKVLPEYTHEFEDKHPAKFKILMYGLGADVTKPYFRQDFIQHRNRFNEVVTCSRWVFNERLDEQWIHSGYASQEAIDKASGSRLVEDTYRARWLTEDAQAALESRDRYDSIYLTEE